MEGLEYSDWSVLAHLELGLRGWGQSHLNKEKIREDDFSREIRVEEVWRRRSRAW